MLYEVITRLRTLFQPAGNTGRLGHGVGLAAVAGGVRPARTPRIPQHPAALFQSRPGAAAQESGAAAVRFADRRVRAAGFLRIYQ